MRGKATGKFFKLGEASRTNIVLPPGATSVLPEDLQCLSYGPDGLEESRVDSSLALATRMKEFPVTWINVQGGAAPAGMEHLTELFGLHELAIEDALKYHQRSKVDTFKEHLFIVLRVPTGKDYSFDTEQLAFFLGKNYVLSFQEKGGGACLKTVRERIRKNSSNICKLGADYLAYTIIDAGMDAYFPVLEQLGERIELLEEKIIGESSGKIPSKIHELKLEVLSIRRAVWPMRDSINTLCRDHNAFITDSTRIYMRDCYDHLSRIIDLVEMYRELTSDLLNIYLSTVNNRMNEIIKVLTVITTLFIPPTFIAGVYGMNFQPTTSPFNMPELNWYFGYPLALLMMLVSAGAVLAFLHRRRWM